MTVIADQIYEWLDGNRLSQFAEQSSAPEDGRAGIAFTALESNRAVEFPGAASGSFTLDALEYDAPTANMLASYNGKDLLAGVKCVDPSAGAYAFVYRVRMMSNVLNPRDQKLAVKQYKFSIEAGGVQVNGKNLYPYTTDITGAANGSTITIGALSATQSLLMTQQVDAVSGSGNLDAKIVADPAGTPVDAKVWTTVAHTDVGSTANHNSAQWALYNGAQAGTDYRYEITAVSGGTWNVQVAVVIIDEL